jgi:uncharacterized phage infection (PIP) family protein YhgE
VQSFPPEVQAFSAVVAFAFLAAIALVWIASRRMQSTSRAIAASLDILGPLDDQARLYGRPLGKVDSWRTAIEKLEPAARLIAEEIDRELVALNDQDGRRCYKLREDEQGAWSFERYASRFANLELIEATPGLLTALGLIGTFVAIALGLSGLDPQPNGVIKGVESLLAGLGGKFVTSILALAAAVVFQLADGLWFRRSMTRAHQSLIDRLNRAFPRLSPAQQFTELLESSRRQEASLSNISSDVTNRLHDLFNTSLLPDLSRLVAQSMTQEIGPSLERVNVGITALEEGIRRLETGKQESLGAELRTLTTNLEASLRSTLEQMGAQFREALSGSANDEFRNAAEAMRGSAGVLSAMNGSFQTVQASLQRMLEDAEARASRSYEEGEGRTRALNELVERLVVQLNDSASTSAAEVQRLMVQAVAGMGEKLAVVTTDLEQRVRAVNEQNLATNQQLLEQVTGTASRTSAETERLLANLGERSQDFVSAADQLRELRHGVERVLAETGTRVRDLQDAGTAFRSVATEAATMARTLRESMDQQRVVLEGSAGMVRSASEVVREQVVVADRSRQTFEAAQEVLGSLDTQLAGALQSMVDRMQDYNRQVEKNFEIILTRVNERMPELFERLEASLQQVGETVEELNDTVKLARSNGR